MHEHIRFLLFRNLFGTYRVFVQIPLQITRDRTGLQQSILKVPIWLRNDENDNTDQSLTYDDFDQSCTDAALESPKPENVVVIECENERLVEKIIAKNKSIKVGGYLPLVCKNIIIK